MSWLKKIAFSFGTAGIYPVWRALQERSAKTAYETCAQRLRTEPLNNELRQEAERLARAYYDSAWDPTTAISA